MIDSHYSLFLELDGEPYARINLGGVRDVAQAKAKVISGAMIKVVPGIWTNSLLYVECLGHSVPF